MGRKEWRADLVQGAAGNWQCRDIVVGLDLLQGWCKKGLIVVNSGSFVVIGLLGPAEDMGQAVNEDWPA